MYKYTYPQLEQHRNCVSRNQNKVQNFTWSAITRANKTGKPTQSAKNFVFILSQEQSTWKQAMELTRTDVRDHSYQGGKRVRRAWDSTLGEVRGLWLSHTKENPLSTAR